MGSSIAYSLMLMQKGNRILFLEPHQPNVVRAQAEFWDLLPVAKATDNEFGFMLDVKELDALAAKPEAKDAAYVLAAGIPRTDISQPKDALFLPNLKIAQGIVRRLPKCARVFVVSNPPVRLAEHLRKKGWNAIPLRACTDNLRAHIGDPQAINHAVLARKGWTQWTPAYACAEEILRTLGNK